VPDGDLLVHCGDITFKGELSVIADFAQWMKELPHQNKVCIHGNHEVGHQRSGPKRQKGLELLAEAGITYLQDSGVEIDGFKVWGSPFSPLFYSWEYNEPRGEPIGRHWAQIPDDTNILITHSMPYGILDSVDDFSRGPQGCEMLARRIKTLKNLKAFFGGHLHREGSRTLVKDGITFVNAAICTDNYAPINKPVVIDL
jgi:Icc-related predicted phosphoesterase